MRISRSLEDFTGSVPPGSRHAVTIGNFDGVHLGHRELIRMTRELAAERSVPSVLMTFDPHPAQVVRRMARPDIITPLPRKLELLEDTGIDHVLILQFTASMAAMDAAAFARTVLAETLAASDLVMGYNFALGRDRGGDFTALRDMGKQYGFAVTQVRPVIAGQETVSSSLIREHINSGDMAGAAALLGRPHSVDGTVIHGQKRGRKLGFPTANIDFPDMILPPKGAYATWVRIMPDPDLRMAMTNLGTNPTFGGEALSLESHLLDFSGDLYGRTVRVHFMDRLRGEIVFKGTQSLAEGLTRDAAATRAILEREKPAFVR